VKKILISLILLLPISAYSFEDLYLECGKTDGYFSIVFGLTQPLKDSLGSMAQTRDKIRVQIATSEFNQFKSGSSYEGWADDSSISIGFMRNYLIDRIEGKAFKLKDKYYSAEEQSRNLEQCRREAGVKGTNPSWCLSYHKETYTEKIYLGDCSKISKSTAKRYADMLHTPKAKPKKKF